jgi:hypothetical protein
MQRKLNATQKIQTPNTPDDHPIADGPIVAVTLWPRKYRTANKNSHPLPGAQWLLAA